MLVWMLLVWIPLSLAVTGSIKEINDTDRTITIKTKDFVKKPTEFEIIAHVPNNPRFKKTFEIFRPEKNVFITRSNSAAENGKFGTIVDKINYATDHAEHIPSKRTNTPWYAKDDELKKPKPEEHDAAN